LACRAEINLGGTLQLLVDLNFIAGAFSPLVKASHEAVIAATRERIVNQALDIVAGETHTEEPDPLVDQLDGWLEAAEVNDHILLGRSVHPCSMTCSQAKHVASSRGCDL
jgi:hypothetical protein